MPRKKLVVLSVPAPCTRAAAAPPRQAGGQYCSACATVVTDFTGMTDRELTDHVRKHGLGCGLFRNDQLDRPLLAPATKARWQRWAAALALLVGISRQSSAQQPSAPAAAAVPGDPQKNDSVRREPLGAADLERLATTSILTNTPRLTGGAVVQQTTYVVDGIIFLPPERQRRPFFRRLLFWKKD